MIAGEMMLEKHRKKRVSFKDEKSFRSISYALLLSVSCFSLLITLAIVCGLLLNNYYKDIDDTDRRLLELKLTLTAPLAQAMWEYNQDALEAQLQGILKLDDIVYVELTLNNSIGKQVLQYGAPPNDTLYDNISLSIPINYGEEGILLGKLTVVASTEGAFQRIKQSAGQILLTIALEIFFVAFFIIWIVSRMLTQHLQKISAFTSNLNLQGLANNLFLNRRSLSKNKVDELDVLVSSINTMRHHLLEDIEQRRLVEMELNNEKQEKFLIEQQRTAVIAASKAKEEFLATMSHEIRTPLNGVIGLTQLLMDTDLGDEQRDYLNKMIITSNNLLGIINDILDFSKIEAGKLKIESVPFKLETVISNLSDQINLNASQKGLKVQLDIDSNIPYSLVGDPLRLGQILLNLSSNAVKFTEQGMIVISAQLVAKSEQQVTLGFSVRDTGIGLSPEQSENLFNAFTQADGSTTRKFGGTGLGLAICKRLVELMEGEITVTSELGVGSCFNFSIRLGLHLDADRTKRQIPQDLIGLKVLVVNDCITSPDILRQYLESFGFEVSMVDSGKAALNTLLTSDESSRYKLVIMEWQMSELTGIEATQYIHRLANLAKIPEMPFIILLNEDKSINALKDAKSAGINAVLSQPIHRLKLCDTIMRVFNGETPPTDTSLIHPNSTTVAAERILGNHRVLLVEDIAINQEVARAMLEKVGLDIEIAVDGQQAVDMVEKGHFDLVLMDIQMPNMDGYQATRLIRENMRFKKLPIIAMTANAMQGDRERCLESGMNDHIAKPIIIDNLYSCLEKWLAKNVELNKDVSDNPGAQPIQSTVIDSRAVKQAALPMLTSFDVETALERVRNDRAFYERLLTDFRESFGDTGNKLQMMLEQKDLRGAQDLSHTLAGVSGNLAAEALNIAARNLNIALKMGDTETLAPLLETLKFHLNKAMSEIDSIIQQK